MSLIRRDGAAVLVKPSLHGRGAGLRVVTVSGGDLDPVARKRRVYFGKIETIDPPDGDFRGDDARVKPPEDGRNGDGVTLGDLARRRVACR